MKSVEVMKCKLVREGILEYEPIKRVDDALNILRGFGVNDSADEVFVVICCNVKLQPIAIHEISHGELSGSLVHPREVFKRACLSNAAALILAHNHPSGDTTPSQDDLKITKRLIEAGKIMGIKIIEHLIVTYGEAYTSFKEEGIIEW